MENEPDTVLLITLFEHLTWVKDRINVQKEEIQSYGVIGQYEFCRLCGMEQAIRDLETYLLYNEEEICFNLQERIAQG